MKADTPVGTLSDTICYQRPGSEGDGNGCCTAARQAGSRETGQRGPSRLRLAHPVSERSPRPGLARWRRSQLLPSTQAQ